MEERNVEVEFATTNLRQMKDLLYSYYIVRNAGESILCCLLY